MTNATATDLQQVMGLVARLPPSNPLFDGEDKKFLGWILSIEAKLLSVGIEPCFLSTGSTPAEADADADANNIKLTSGKTLTASGLRQLDASIFAMVAQSLSGVPLVTIGRLERSGIKALQALQERYPSSTEHINRLKADLRTSSGNVKTTSRLSCFA